MRARSPTQTQHSASASASNTSGSGSGSSPKANFKHALPHQMSLSYFMDVRRRLNEASRASVSGSSCARRVGKQNGTAETCVKPLDEEDAVVCRDLVESCRMLEAAPMDGFRTQSETLKRQSSFSSRLGATPTTPSLRATPTPTHAGRPPLSRATPTQSSRSGDVAFSQGRTADGLFGLNHFTPQKDAHNGPAQSFLEQDCPRLSSSACWQSWADNRKKFFDAAATVAAEVFTFACADETIVSVSPSTPPTAAGGAPSVSASSRNSPSTPFRRSPRPDYESRLLDLQSRFVKISAPGCSQSSFLSSEKALMIHIWRSHKAAMRFSHAWQRLWQAIFEHRIVGIHCPLSTMFSIQGVTISVTAVPPAYVDRVPPIQNIFTPFIKADVADVSLARSSKSLKDSRHGTVGVQSPLLQSMVLRLFSVLHIPQDESILEDYGDLSLFAGVDNRWYLMHLGPVLSHCTPTLCAISRSLTAVSPVRHELLREICLEHAEQQAMKRSVADSSPDWSNEGIERHIVTRAIPKAVRNAVAILPLSSPESRRPDVLFKEGFLSMMLHDHGINMSYLYHVYEHCVTMGASLTPLQQHSGSNPRRVRTPSKVLIQTESGDQHVPVRRESTLQHTSSFRGDGGEAPFPTDGDDSYVAGVPASDSLHMVASHGAMARKKEASGAVASGNSTAQAVVHGECYKLIAQACCMEMLARTVKDLARLDVAGGFTTTSDFRTSTVVRLDMVNRIARLAASRDRDFLLGHVLPHLKRKFNCPDDFETSWDVLPTGALLRVLSLHFGSEYGVQEGRFHVFTPFAQKKAVYMHPTVVIDAMLNRDERRMMQSVASFWDDANQVIGRALVEDHAALAREQPAGFMSPLHAALLSKAICFSIVARAHRNTILAYVQSPELSKASKVVSFMSVFETLTYASIMEGSRPADKSTELGKQLEDVLNRDVCADDAPIATTWDHHLCSRWLKAKRIDECVRCMRALVHTVTTIPHVDFVYHAPLAQLLKDAESGVVVLSSEDPNGASITSASALREYLKHVVEDVVGSLRRWNRMSNAARYLLRVTQSVYKGALPNPKASTANQSNVNDAISLPETFSADAVRVAQLCYSTHATQYGSHDARTLLALYFACVLSLCATRDSSPATVSAVHNLQKVVRKHESLSPQLQVSFGRTNTVHTLLVKMETLLATLHADAVSLATIRTAIYHAERYRNSIFLIQSVGRGYRRRHMIAEASGRCVLIAPPKRPSAMVYFDGQMPLTLGQAANLGISLEDESTRQPSAAVAADQHSDVSSITGSFVSGSNMRSRFSSSGRGPQQTQQIQTPVGHANASFSTATVRLPDGSPDMLSSSRRADSAMFTSPSYSDSMHHTKEPTRSTVGGTTQQHIARPVPRSSGPALPEGPIPDSVVQRVMEYQQSMTEFSPPVGLPLDSLGSSRATRELEHDRLHLPQAWDETGGEGSWVASDPRRVLEVEDHPMATNDHRSPLRHVRSDAGGLGLTPQLARSQETCAVNMASMSETVSELFALCDKDSDGVATVQECVEGVSKFKWMPVDDLRELLSSVAFKQKRSGLGSFFGKSKDVLTVTEFQDVLVRAGVVSMR